MKFLLALLVLTSCVSDPNLRKITMLDPVDWQKDHDFICVYLTKDKEMICGDHYRIETILYGMSTDDYYINKVQPLPDEEFWELKRRDRAETPPLLDLVQPITAYDRCHFHVHETEEK